MRSIRSVAARFGVAHTTVLRWQRGGAPVRSDDQLRQWLKARACGQKITQSALAAQIGRSSSQLTAWKKRGAPLNDLKALRAWAEGRGLLKATRTQRSVASIVGLNEGTLSDWKMLGAPVTDVSELRSWMTQHGRRSRASAKRNRRYTPLWKVAEAAGITYGTLARVRKEGAPVKNAEQLRKWLKHRRAQRKTRRHLANTLGVSVDTLRRWEGKGAPIWDVAACRLWSQQIIERRAESNLQARLRRSITRRLRSRFQQALRRRGGQKSMRLRELIGCSPQALLEHLEASFSPGMSWANRQRWHIDHLRPCASFDLTQIDQQRVCFHFSNLRPMWAEDNMIKAARIDWSRSDGESHS